MAFGIILDVVPVGEGWDFDPFGAELKGDLLIGRGSQDNKGPAIGMLYVMECIQRSESCQWVISCACL